MKNRLLCQLVKADMLNSKSQQRPPVGLSSLPPGLAHSFTGAQPDYSFIVLGWLLCYNGRLESLNRKRVAQKSWNIYHLTLSGKIGQLLPYTMLGLVLTVLYTSPGSFISSEVALVLILLLQRKTLEDTCWGDAKWMRENSSIRTKLWLNT